MSLESAVSKPYNPVIVFIFPKNRSGTVFGAPANFEDSGDFEASGDARAGISREFPRRFEDFRDFPEIPEDSEGFSGISKGFPLSGGCPGRDFPFKYIDLGRTAGEINGFP